MTCAVLGSLHIVENLKHILAPFAMRTRLFLKAVSIMVSPEGLLAVPQVQLRWLQCLLQKGECGSLWLEGGAEGCWNLSAIRQSSAQWVLGWCVQPLAEAEPGSKANCTPRVNEWFCQISWVQDNPLLITLDAMKSFIPTKFIVGNPLEKKYTENTGLCSYGNKVIS